MNHKIYISTIIALLAINIYTLVNFKNYRKRSELYTNLLTHEPDMLHNFGVNMSVGIANSNYKLENIAVKDSLGNETTLHDFFKNAEKSLLVCRFSERNCESCVNFAINTLLQHADSISKANILFLGASYSNRISKKQKPLYDIHTFKVANTALLNLPAEDLGYPYYFILNRDMTISNVFIPDKGTPKITNMYLKTIYERYFK